MSVVALCAIIICSILVSSYEFRRWIKVKICCFSINFQANRLCFVCLYFAKEICCDTYSVVGSQYILLKIQRYLRSCIFNRILLLALNTRRVCFGSLLSDVRQPDFVLFTTVRSVGRFHTRDMEKMPTNDPKSFT